jgi:hypothetical protein
MKVVQVDGSETGRNECGSYRGRFEEILATHSYRRKERKEEKKNEEGRKGREGGRVEGRGREGRKGIGLISSQQEFRVSRITLFRANCGRCAHTNTNTHTHVCNAKVK